MPTTSWLDAAACFLRSKESQTMAADSSSLLQARVYSTLAGNKVNSDTSVSFLGSIFSGFQRGRPLFSVGVTPIFANVSAAGVADPASSQEMQQRGSLTSLSHVGSVGGSKGSAAEGWLKDGTATALQYTRKLRKSKDEHDRLKARAQNLSERVIAQVAKCKQNKFAYSRSGLKLSEGKVCKDEHELAHLQQKLLQVRESIQQRSTLESHLRASNAKARTGRIVFASVPTPP